MAGSKTSAGPRKSSSPPQYWCHPQQDGHPPLYFHGHALISRADYVSAVGPDDCDPHIATGQGAKRKRGPKTVREQLKRM